MAPHARCDRSLSPSPPSATGTEITTRDPEDLENFPWNKLNTLPDHVATRGRRPILHIQVRCNRYLTALDAAKHKTEGLKLLIESIKALVQQSWRVLLVYFDEESECACKERPWSHVEWRRWDVVAVFARMAVAYNRECENAARNSMVLFTDDVDLELLSLANDLLNLGDAAVKGGVIAIREWEREGTMHTLRSCGLFSEAI